MIATEYPITVVGNSWNSLVKYLTCESEIFKNPVIDSYRLTFNKIKNWIGCFWKFCGGKRETKMFLFFSALKTVLERHRILCSGFEQIHCSLNLDMNRGLIVS